MDEGPKQIEIDQISIEEKCVKALRGLKKAEKKANRDFSKFINRYEDVVSELSKYKGLMFDSSRNYIQMNNQNSQFVDNNLLNVTKEHIKRLELNTKAQTDYINSLKELDNTYKEYINNLDKLESSWDDLVSIGNSWYNDANDIIKEKSDYGSGSKLGKLEKSLEKNERKLKKSYDLKIRNHQLVEKSYDHMNQVLQKFKGILRNIRW